MLKPCLLSCVILFWLTRLNQLWKCKIVSLGLPILLIRRLERTFKLQREKNTFWLKRLWIELRILLTNRVKWFRGISNSFSYWWYSLCRSAQKLEEMPAALSAEFNRLAASPAPPSCPVERWITCQTASFSIKSPSVHHPVQPISSKSNRWIVTAVFKGYVGAKGIARPRHAQNPQSHLYPCPSLRLETWFRQGCFTLPFGESPARTSPHI